MGILDGEGWGSFRGVRLRKTEMRSALAMSLSTRFHFAHVTIRERWHLFPWTSSGCVTLIMNSGSLPAPYGAQFLLARHEHSENTERTFHALGAGTSWKSSP